MGWRKFRTEVNQTDYLAVYEALAKLFEVPADGASPDISETKTARGALSVARHLGEGFFAARLQEHDHVLEAFLITPTQAPPQLGMAAYGGADEIPPPLRPWLRLDDRCDDLPSFTSLTALLASAGRATIVERESENAQAEIAYLKELLAEQGDEVRRVKAQLRTLKQHTSTKGREAEDISGTPWRLDELGEWCAQNEERIVVLPRARAGAKKSLYEDPALIFAALELLAGPYRDLRLGIIEHAAFSDELVKSGLRLEGSVSPSIAGEQGEAYFVLWGKRRHFLGLHLLKGGGRDERYCFRLYFFWDTGSQRAVVGSLPAHLDNSLS